jgi:hypothetical protein
MNVSIVYGFAEGAYHSKKLKDSLRSSGYNLTDSVSESDVIIAHSGGCYMIPTKIKAKLVLLVGIPYMIDKHPITELLIGVSKGPKDKNVSIKYLFNTYYFLRHPRVWLKMNKSILQLNWPETKHSLIIAVRNYTDNFSESGTIKQLAKDKNWLFRELSGGHDDLWNNPKNYLKIIKSYA